ncbi:MAG: HAMP domain-containing protein [Myxococcales bacterium]|nr:HAMP domain-containing protein [Myxococcales bacterium]
MGALLLLALAPLYVAVDGLTRAITTQIWERHAHALGRAIAGHVGEARLTRAPGSLDGLLRAQLAEGVSAIALYDRTGARQNAAGGEAERGILPGAVTPSRDDSHAVTTPRGPGLVVIVASHAGSVATLLDTEPSATRAAPVVRLVALYMALLGVILLALSYFALTRIIVTPVARIVRAAERVAAGAPTLQVPAPTSRELAELGRALDTMTKQLRSEEEEQRRTIGELRARTTELARAESHVVRSEKLASVGRLAAGLAHEIGNPLTAILSFQELLLDSQHLDEEERSLLVHMKRETERVSRVLGDLLAFARPDRHGIRTSSDADLADSAERRDVCSVAQAVEHAVQLVRPQQSFREVELAMHIPVTLSNVAIGIEQLEQVLVNLLINAADATGVHPRVITIRATETEQRVSVAVEDNGGGIAVEARGRLFEPFFTTKDVGAGTGLGLAVCRGLVEGAGGSIHHEDGTEGARFVVELPEARDF